MMKIYVFLSKETPYSVKIGIWRFEIFGSIINVGVTNK